MFPASMVAFINAAVADFLVDDGSASLVSFSPKFEDWAFNNIRWSRHIWSGLLFWESDLKHGFRLSHRNDHGVGVVDGSNI